MENRKFSIKDRVKSIQHALRGLFHFLNYEHNARIHLLAAVLVIAFSLYTGLKRWEWICILAVIFLVFIAEMFNTAIEKLSDKLHPERDPLIGRVKDIAAGAVLLASFFAVIVGLMIFLPKFAG